MNTSEKYKVIKRVFLIIAFMLSAFLAGIFGEFFTRAYLSNMAFFRDFYFIEADNLGQRDLIISQPQKVVVEQNIRLNQLANEIRPSVLGIYAKKKANKNLSDNLYLPQELAGQSSVLTSDGWLISSSSVITGNKDAFVIYYNNKIYALENMVRDDLTGTVFIKINAQNLPVIKLADMQKVFNGQQIFIFNSYYEQINLANIIDHSYRPIYDKSDLIISSQDLSKRILADKNFPANLIGSPVFDLEGEIIGLYDQAGPSNSQMIPINFISSAMNQILKNEKIKRPYLGLYYINLGKAVSFNDNSGQNIINKGAYVQSVLADSPLYNKVVKGDIILSLENQDLDANNDLVDLLMGYKTGQEIRLKYQHLDKEQEINVTLK
jgi:serine protease Do